MSDPFRTTPGMIPPSEARPLSTRNILLTFVLGMVLIAAAATWFVYFSKPDLEARERAIREALGLAQTEEYVFVYPVTGTPTPLDPRCDRPCADRQREPGKDLAQVGPAPQGFVLVDAPPDGCSFLNMRFTATTTPLITDTPLPVFLDAAPIEQMQRCNPDVPIRRNEAGLVQVPPWYRSTTGVAVSVPLGVVSTGLTFRAAVCVQKTDGSIGQYAGDDSMADLAEETPRFCGEV